MSITKEECRSLQEGSLPKLQDLLSLLKLEFDGDADLLGADPILASPHHLSEATSYALLAETIAACVIAQMQGGSGNEKKLLSIKCTDAIHQLHSSHFLRQSGYPMSVGAEFVPTNGLFACRDGRYIMIEAGPPYVKLERGYLNFFDCGNNREALAKAISQFDSEDLQEKLSNAKLPASLAYSQDEWRRHAQGLELSRVPVIEIEKIGDAKKIPFLNDAAGGPLSGLKVLDFTHVLAGPRSMRTLANYGAQVLHISSPYHPDSLAQNLLVNRGKRSAYLDLRNENEHKQMLDLACQADVFTSSYRAAVNERFGLTARELASNHRGIVCLTINAYGHSGPWYERPGFDQNGQAATGFALKEGEREMNNSGSIAVPLFSPVFYLNDFLTAYLAAAGVMSALILRAQDGGSYHVKVSLSRTAMWVQDLGLISPDLYLSKPSQDQYDAQYCQYESPFGTITELAEAVSSNHLLTVPISPVKPFGADRPEFLS